MVFMETLKVQLEKKKASYFRQKAMGFYGYSKGSISKAMNTAIDDWLSKVEAKNGLLSARDLMGVASDLKGSSLGAQKKAVKWFGEVD